MYSYQHRYHAGNLADVHKHVVLLATLMALREKEAPFCVVDAFAGEGVYDLSCAEAQKIREYEKGYALAKKGDHPLIRQLVHLAETLGPTSYPGSPAIIASLLRPQDQALFLENHPQAYAVLEGRFGKDSQIRVMKEDSYRALPRLFPLSKSRGLLFLDPSYEVKAEYGWIPEVLRGALRKYRQGSYIVWYPLLEAGLHKDMVEAILALGCPNVWASTWYLEEPTRMLGSGIIALNLPYAAQRNLESCRGV